MADQLEHLRVPYESALKMFGGDRAAMRKALFANRGMEYQWSRRGLLPLDRSLILRYDLRSDCFFKNGNLRADYRPDEEKEAA